MADNYNPNLRPSSGRSIDTSPGSREGSHAFLHAKPSRKAHRMAAKQVTSPFDTSQIRKHHAKRRTVIAIIVVLVVIVGLAFAAVNLLGLFRPGDVEPGQSVQVSIAEGSTATNIAQQLKTSGVVADVNDFLQVVADKQATDKLKPGGYLLVTAAPYDEIVDQLVSGPNIDAATLTVPEGLTIAKTASAVEQATGIPAADFQTACQDVDAYREDYAFLQDPQITTLEGFLYPKTYKIKKDAVADDVVRILLDQFALETNTLDLSYADAHNLSLFDVVTIASLIENETAQAEEREIIASVVYNRLAKGMKLQIDATVVYALGSKHKEGAALSWKDIEVSSPYNTYKVDGLPAGPICSPRLDSIDAAAHPKETSYIYYVLKSKDGKHTFCTTSEQFEKAKAAYEKTFGIK